MTAAVFELAAIGEPTLNKFAIDIVDITNTKAFVDSIKTYKALNKGLPRSFADIGVVTVFTDWDLDKLSTTWGILRGKITVSPSTRVGDFCLFVVDNTELLRNQTLGRTQRKGLNKTLAGAKLEAKKEVNEDKKGKMGSTKSASQYMVPFWNPGPEGVRNFIDQLEEANNLGIFDSEGELIYAALCKSNKPEIYSQLSTDEKASIQKFAVFLAQNFGDTPNELKRKFQQMRQTDQEDELAFLQRCTRAYFAAKSIKGIPSGTNFTNDHKEDISLVFISGLRVPEVRKALLTRIDEVDFDKLGRVAKRISLNLRELSNMVYHVGGPDQGKQQGYGDRVFSIQDNEDTMDNFNEHREHHLERKIDALCHQVQNLKRSLNGE